MRLRIVRGASTEDEIYTDHVIAATGYVVDLRSVPFIAPELRADVLAKDGAPILSPWLESSVRGMYFVGLPAANVLGPVMRFVCGSGIAASRVTQHLGASLG